MLNTGLCRQLGIEYPILSVGMGMAAGADLAAAVSNAGGCGVIGTSRLPPAGIRERIAQVRAKTRKPFGVNVILALLQEGQIEACLDEGIPLLVLFWGDPSPHVSEAHRRGTKVFIQVGSVEEARAAASAGVDGIIAQGIEAGGHVKSRTSLWSMLPAVVEAVHPVPVVAAGGIANGRGLVAALSLGAQGVSMGTRFVASEEAFVPQEYKERLVNSTAEDTVYSGLFDIGWPDAPHRTLRNRTVSEWEAAGRPPSGRRPGEGTIIGTTVRPDGTTADVLRYASFMVTPQFKGDLDYVPLWAGESCSQIKDIKPAAQIVREIMREAEEVVAQMRRA